MEGKTGKKEQKELNIESFRAHKSIGHPKQRLYVTVLHVSKVRTEVKPAFEVIDPPTSCFSSPFNG